MVQPFLKEGLHLERRLFHLLVGSSLPVLGLVLSREMAILVCGALAGLAIVVEAARFTLPDLNRLLVGWFGMLLRKGEEGRVTGATYMVMAALLTFVLYRPFVAVPALFFLSVGDPVAAAVGLRWGRARFWGKSLEGTAALFLASLAMAGIMLVALDGSRWWVMVVGAGVAAVVELLPLRLNDNVTIPVLGGGAMALANRLGL